MNVPLQNVSARNSVTARLLSDNETVAILNGETVIELIIAEGLTEAEVLDHFLELFHYPDAMARTGGRVYAFYTDRVHGGEHVVVYNNNWEAVETYQKV